MYKYKFVPRLLFLLFLIHVFTITPAASYPEHQPLIFSCCRCVSANPFSCFLAVLLDLDLATRLLVVCCWSSDWRWDDAKLDAHTVMGQGVIECGVAAAAAAAGCGVTECLSVSQKSFRRHYSLPLSTPAQKYLRTCLAGIILGIRCIIIFIIIYRRPATAYIRI